MVIVKSPPGATGYLVKTVAKGSPGDEMGLRGGDTLATIGGEQIVLGGDILLALEGMKVGSAADLMKIRDVLSRLRPGDPLTATVLRAGKVIELVGKVP